MPTLTLNSTPTFPSLYVGNSWRDTTGSNVVGHELSGDFPPGEERVRRWRIAKYAFSIPKSHDGENIVKVKTLNFNFNEGESGYVVQGGTIEKICYVISNESRIYTGDRNDSINKVVTNASGHNVQPVMPIISGQNLTAYNNAGQKTTFNIEPGKTYYLYILGNPESTKSNGTGVYGWQWWSTSSINIEVDYETTTKCKEPDNFDVRRSDGEVGAIIPNGDTLLFIFNSDIDLGGINNSFIGYRVYYKIDGRPSTTNYTNFIDFKTTQLQYQGSYNIVIDEQHRGKNIYFGCQVMGQAGEQYYSNLTGIFSIPVNIPSQPPQPSPSVEKIPSTGGCVYFNINMANDPTYIINKRALKYRFIYENDLEDASWNTVPLSTNNLTISTYLSASKGKCTYEFKVFDGLEDSEIDGGTLQVNVMPNAELVLTPNLALTSYPLDSNDLYCYEFQNVQINQLAGAADTEWYLYLTKLDSEKNFVERVQLMQIYPNKDITIEDIRDIEGLLSLEEKRYYQLQIQGDDGIETTDYILGGFEGTSGLVNTFCITPPPSMQLFNLSDGSTLEGYENYVDNILGIKTIYDTGYPISEVLLITASKTVNLKNKQFSQIDENTQAVIYDLGSSSLDFLKGQNFNVVCRLHTSTNTTATTGTLGPIKRINTAPLNTITIETNQGAIYPFSWEQYHFSLNNFLNLTFGQERDYGIYNWKNDLDDNKRHYYQIQFLNIEDLQSGDKAELNVFSDIDFTEEILGDSINLTISGSKLWDCIKSCFTDFDSAQNDKQNIRIKCSILNDFNKEVYVMGIIDFDFKEKPVLLESYTTDIKLENDISIYSPSFALKEAMKLLLKSKIKSYNTNPVATIYISRSFDQNGEIWSEYEKYGNPIRFSKDDNNLQASYKTPLTYSCEESDYFYVIPEIARERYLAKFKIVISTDGAENEFALNNAVEVRGHYSGVVKLNEVLYYANENNNSLNLNYEMQNPGLLEDITEIENSSISFEYDLLQVNADGTSPVTIADNFSENVIKYNFNENETYMYVQIKVTSYYTINGYKSKKVFYSNILPVYNIKPTVAYRRNHLGINHNDFNSEKYEKAVLVISQYDDRHLIYLNGIGGEGVVDLKTGEINGMIIDGGTWGEI